ncbi:hypothetical protein J3369_10400 [Alteromonas sp. NFXS44]|uniref:hypothetical protein n=1 Tax=Alteromonas sp. NFXS44 TaxID=2818435 RepID=UPI0032DFCFDF
MTLTSDLVFTQLATSKAVDFGSLAASLDVSSESYLSQESELRVAWFEYVANGSARNVLTNRKAHLSQLTKGITPIEVNAYAGRLVQDTGDASAPWGLRMIVAFNVPDTQKAEIDKWYVEEHIPLLMKSQYWLRARRYECEMVIGDTPFSSIAVHDLVDQRALDSAERKVARDTPWRASYSDSNWFKQAGRFYYCNNAKHITEGA